MRNYLFIAAVILLGGSATAQQNKGRMAISKLILPNGKELKPEKLDSLNKAWGEDRVLFSHNANDEDGVIHLVHKTDEYIRKEKAESKALSSLVGQAAPQFELTDVQGKKWSLKALRGKVVVLNFWFTSCAACITEMPELNKLTEQYKEKDVVFLALTYNNKEQVATFLKKRPFSYTILTDSKQVDKSFKVSSWPTSMVIDKKGIIRFTQVSGENITARLKAAIDKAK